MDRYSRQMRFAPIGPGGQEKLARSAVLIVGMGALGAVLANHMARAGVGLIRFVDRDYVERSNLQRQMLFDEDDAEAGLPKAVAAERKLSRINSGVRYEAVVADVTAANVSELLRGVDVVLDGTDNFRTRLLLNDACFRAGVPYVYGGAVSAQGMTAVFVPGETSCLRCLIGSEPDSGGATCETVGVVSPIVDIVASFQAVEALKLLVGDAASRRRSLLSLEIWRHQLFDMRLAPPRPDCPTCGEAPTYPSLRAEESEATTLCGRETVQVRAGRSFSLDTMAERLSAAGARIERNPFLLRASLPEGERLVLFPDGRTLVQGTEDIARAKSLFDRYIGG